MFAKQLAEARALQQQRREKGQQGEGSNRSEAQIENGEHGKSGACVFESFTHTRIHAHTHARICTRTHAHAQAHASEFKHTHARITQAVPKSSLS